MIVLHLISDNQVSVWVRIEKALNGMDTWSVVNDDDSKILIRTHHELDFQSNRCWSTYAVHCVMT